MAILFYKDFNPRGYLKVDYDFCHPTPFISKFSPHGRVLDIQKNRKECTQKMAIDPVYFDVRLPQKFNQAQIKLWYKKEADTKLQIGPALDLDNWQWQLADINYLTTEGNWLLGTSSYDLKSAYYDSNDLRFLISSPGLSENGSEIIFNKIEIEFLSEPLTKDNFTTKLKNWLKFSNLYKIYLFLTS